MRNKMEKASRAKLFQPYDSLKGFSDIIKQKERIVVPFKELSSDNLYELDWKIKSIKVGMIIKIIYYDQKEYISLEGMVVDIDINNKKYIRIVNQIIELKNIVEIEL